MQKKLSAFCGVDEITKALTAIYCQPTISTEKLGAWLASREFDALPSHLTCMAAAASSTVCFANIPESLTPRLRGIVKYIHTLNSGMFSAVRLLGTVCNQAQIQVLLLEETALYMHFKNVPQRHLWQVSVGVRSTQYEEVLNLAQKIGFTIERHLHAAVARQGITRQVVIRPLADHSYLWESATELKSGNATFLCSQPAAMLVEACQRTFRALTKPQPQISLVHWCMDMKILLHHLSDADWLCAKEIAQKEHAKCHIRFLLEVYATITETIVKEAAAFGSTKDVERTLRLLKAYLACPTKKKLRHLYLLYRLRRLDSIAATILLLARRLLRKLKG